MWTQNRFLKNFGIVAKLCDIEIDSDMISIEILPMPHKPPTNLPKGIY